MNTEELIKKQTNWLKAIFGCLAAITAAIFIMGALLVPRIYHAVGEVEQSLTEIDTLVKEGDEALQNINNIDFEHLNQSINDLSTITKALSSIFGNSK